MYASKEHPIAQTSNIAVGQKIIVEDSWFTSADWGTLESTTSRGRVTLEVDENSYVSAHNNDCNLEVTVKITYWIALDQSVYPTVPSGFEPVTKILELDFDAIKTSTTKFKDFYDVEDAHAMEVEITLVNDVACQNPPPLKLSAELFVERSIPMELDPANNPPILNLSLIHI